MGVISADAIVPDPLDPQAFNRYSYVLNNPILFTDPSGHSFDRDFDFNFDPFPDSDFVAFFDFNIFDSDFNAFDSDSRVLDFDFFSDSDSPDLVGGGGFFPSSGGILGNGHRSSFGLGGIRTDERFAIAIIPLLYEGALIVESA